MADVIRVLVVDDDPHLRTLLCSQFESDPRFEVVGEAENGRIALDLRAARHPDVIIMDLAMPVMDGLEAIPIIRSTDPDVKIAVLSGFEAAEIEEHVLSLGADAFLEKTTSIFSLVDRVYSIARPSALRRLSNMRRPAEPAMRTMRTDTGLRQLRGLEIGDPDES